MTLQEKLNSCEYQTRKLFKSIDPLMRQNALYGWLEESVGGLAKRLSVSPGLLYRGLADMRKNGILRKGKNGHYCPFIVAEMWLK